MFALRLWSRLPLWFVQGCGALAGWLAFLASPSYRRRLLDNARLAGVRPWGAVAQAGCMLASRRRGFRRFMS